MTKKELGREMIRLVGDYRGTRHANANGIREYVKRLPMHVQDKIDRRIRAHYVACQRIGISPEGADVVFLESVESAAQDLIDPQKNVDGHAPNCGPFQRYTVYESEREFEKVRLTGPVKKNEANPA